jgi:hypothetical protein
LWRMVPICLAYGKTYAQRLSFLSVKQDEDD